MEEIKEKLNEMLKLALEIEKLNDGYEWLRIFVNPSAKYFACDIETKEVAYTATTYNSEEVKYKKKANKEEMF